MKHLFHFSLLTGLLLLALSGCVTTDTSDADFHPTDNSGKMINTNPGEPLPKEHLLGKWDVDGQRTNTLNGAGGILAIPLDVGFDVLGSGWHFKDNGVLLVDKPVGATVESWSLEGDQLSVVISGKTTTYTARFVDGFLYLKDASGRFTAFERNKFFGL